MQAVIAIPDLDTLQQYGGARQALLRKVCGVPLLVRVVMTALRAGVDSVLILWPTSVPITICRECLASVPRGGANTVTVVLRDSFNPGEPGAWTTIETLLENSFLWLPWNWVTHKRALAELAAVGILPSAWMVPARIERRALLQAAPFRLEPNGGPEGVRVTSPATAKEAERLVIAKSGKPLDGIYSTFNRWLCRPFVRWLSYTPVTPNAVTLAGLVAAALSAWMFAKGFYAAYVAGALLFFLSGLFDEMDGMLARTKFRESAFGTWFEGFVDNATYLLVFVGMTIGLYRQRGPAELGYGIALIVGCVASVVVINLQRRRSTDSARPHEYLGKMYGLMDKDSSNLVSWVARHIHVFLKKAVSIHYLLLFSVIGALPVFLRLAALGSNLTWILGLYLGRRFFRRAAVPGTAPSIPFAA